MRRARELTRLDKPLAHAFELGGRRKRAHTQWSPWDLTAKQKAERTRRQGGRPRTKRAPGDRRWHDESPDSKQKTRRKRTPLSPQKKAEKKAVADAKRTATRAADLERRRAEWHAARKSEESAEIVASVRAERERQDWPRIISREVCALIRCDRSEFAVILAGKEAMLQWLCSTTVRWYIAPIALCGLWRALHTATVVDTPSISR